MILPGQLQPQAGAGALFMTGTFLPWPCQLHLLSQQTLCLAWSTQHLLVGWVRMSW